jgi:hypothetical protein
VKHNIDGSVTVSSGGRRLCGNSNTINIANSGTSSRFLLALLALSPNSRVTITGEHIDRFADACASLSHANQGMRACTSARKETLSMP